MTIVQKQYVNFIWGTKNSSQERKLACRIWHLKRGNRWSCYCTDTGPTKLHNLMTWHCIALHRGITLATWNTLTQLAIRVHSWVNRSRNTIYLKVLLTCIWIVNTLAEKMTTPHRREVSLIWKPCRLVFAIIYHLTSTAAASWKHN